jgi:hypothetical protein
VLSEVDGYVGEDVLTFLEGVGGSSFGRHEDSWDADGVAREVFREVRLKLAQCSPQYTQYDIAQYRGSAISPRCKGIRIVLPPIRYTSYCIVDNILTQYAILCTILSSVT